MPFGISLSSNSSSSTLFVLSRKAHRHIRVRLNTKYSIYTNTYTIQKYTK